MFISLVAPNYDLITFDTEKKEIYYNLNRYIEATENGDLGLFLDVPRKKDLTSAKEKLIKYGYKVVK